MYNYTYTHPDARAAGAKEEATLAAKAQSSCVCSVLSQINKIHIYIHTYIYTHEICMNIHTHIQMRAQLVPKKSKTLAAKAQRSCVCSAHSQINKIHIYIHTYIYTH